MRRIMAMADRAALLSFRGLVALNLLFFFCFLLVALIAARTVDAAPQVAQAADHVLSPVATQGEPTRKE
ncbi:hypothetical protein [Aquamicrobium terrae]